MGRSSSQKFIGRNRPPRVQIEYETKLFGAQKLISLPFVVGVLADLSGSSDRVPLSLGERQMKDIDIDSFDARMRDLAPRVTFTVPDTLRGGNELAVDLSFESMDDFSPAAVARNVAGLNKLLKARIQLTNFIVYMDGKGGAESLVGRILNDESLLKEIASKGLILSNDGKDNLVEQERDLSREKQETSEDSFSNLLIKEFKPRSDPALKQLKSALQKLAELALTKLDSHALEPVATINEILHQIDLKLTQQINLIMHHPEFQQLEGAWRGLNYLIENTETDDTLKIRFMSVSKKELGRTINRYKGSNWDQSHLFKKIYEDEYGTFGGEPYGCLIGDYEFGNSPQDVEILSGMAQIAAAAHTPFIAAASPSVMQMESWQEIANPRDLTKVFMTPDYAAWRSLRMSEDSRYLALTIPRFLARLPYGNDTNPVEEFSFQEDIKGVDPTYYTWCNSAYLMGVNITRAFKLHGWCSRIRGLESGGMVEGLPIYTFPSDDGDIVMGSPTEVLISDRWEAELARNGFMPLVNVKNTDLAAFFGAPSFHKPEEYDDPDATAAAALAARLPYLIACCRFAHYLKCIARDNIGTFRDRAEMEKWLNDWIRQYVDYDPSISSEMSKARKPLANAEIVLDEIDGDPSHYTAKFYLKPHYQLAGLAISLRLVSKLPSVNPA